jgi:hypothetical protein
MSNWLLIPVYDKDGEPIPGRWEFFPGGLLDEDVPCYEYTPFRAFTEANRVQD